MKHKKLFEHELNEAAAAAVAERAMRSTLDIDEIDEIEFNWRYSRDGMDTTTRSTVYPDAAIRDRARQILEEWMR